MKTQVNEKIIADVKAKNPGVEVYRLEAAGVTVLVTGPDDARWSSFQDVKEKSGTKAFKQLVRDCLLWPSDDEFLECLKTKPALSNLFGVKLMEIAGLEEEAVAKKV